MTKPRKRRTKQETLALRSEVFDLRQRGFSLREIGVRLSISHQLAHHHLSEFYAGAVGEITSKTARRLLVEAILRSQADRQYALRQREGATQSRERLAWMNVALAAGKRLDLLLCEAGLPTAPDKQLIRDSLRSLNRLGVRLGAR